MTGVQTCALPIYIFNKDISLMRVIFLIPVILMGLSIIPVFFIGKRLGGNIGGFFAAMIVALNSALLGRTPAGFSDTDPYNILFPLFIAWVFIEAFESDNIKKKITLALTGGLLCGLFSITWTGWWYVFDIILVTIAIYLIYQLIINKNKIKEGLNRYLSIKRIKNTLILGVSFFFGSMVFVSLFRNFHSFMISFRGPLKVVTLKAVAVKSLWQIGRAHV